SGRLSRDYRPAPLVRRGVSWTGFPRRRVSGSEVAGRGDGLFGDAVDHWLEVARLRVYGQLPVGARAFLQDPLDVVHRPPRAQLVDHVVHELAQLLGQVPGRHLGLLAEVDELAVEAVAHGAPAVLRDEVRHVLAEPEVALAQPQQLATDGLDQRGQADGLLHPRRGVADPELQR